MTTTLAILAALFWQMWPFPGPGRAPTSVATIALISHKIAIHTSGTSNVTTDAVDCTGANFVVVAVSLYGNGVGTYTFADSESNSYASISQASGVHGGDDDLKLFYAFNATVSNSFTVTATRTSGDPYLNVAMACFSNVSSPLSDSAQSAITTQATAQPGEVTAAAGNLVIASLGSFSLGVYTLSIDGGFTVTDYGQRDGVYVGLAYLLSEGGNANPTWTYSGSTVYHAGINAVFVP